MIDKNDKFANILNKLNIIFIVTALIGGVFMYIDFFFLHNFYKITMVTGLGFLFLVMGITLYMYYLYLLLRWVKRKLNCSLSEYWEIAYIEIEGNGAFEKYYPKQLEVVQPDGSIRHYKGDILATFERSYINTINATFNNARA